MAWFWEEGGVTSLSDTYPMDEPMTLCLPHLTLSCHPTLPVTVAFDAPFDLQGQTPRLRLY